MYLSVLSWIVPWFANLPSPSKEGSILDTFKAKLLYSCEGIICSISIVYVIFLLALRISAPGELAAIERLREDFNRTNNDISNHIITLVAEKNQLIGGYKKYRSLWWSKACISKKWEDVRFIVIKSI